MTMKFQATMRSGNAAFSEGNAANETARILREVADRIDRGETDGNLRDVNGNTVGQWILDIEEDEEADETDETDAD